MPKSRRMNRKSRMNRRANRKSRMNRKSRRASRRMLRKSRRASRRAYRFFGGFQRMMNPETELGGGTSTVAAPTAARDMPMPTPMPPMRGNPETEFGGGSTGPTTPGSVDTTVRTPPQSMEMPSGRNSMNIM